jgi:hypothetical protein
VSVSQPYNVTLHLSNARPYLGQTVGITTTVNSTLSPFNYAYAGLPPGCVSVDQAQLGCLPTQAGQYNLSVAVTNSQGSIESAFASMLVIFNFTVTAPNATTVGTNITITVTVGGNNSSASASWMHETSLAASSYTYAYSGLPVGCTSEDVAVLQCTPTAVGVYHITISVHDQAGDKATQHLTISVATPTPAKPSTSPGFLGLPGVEGYLVLGLPMLAMGVGLGLLWNRRRRSGPTGPDPSKAQEQSGP